MRRLDWQRIARAEDEAVASRIDDCQDVEERVERSKIFVAYLNECWEAFQGQGHAFDWAEVRGPLDRDHERIERTLAKRLF